MSPLTGNRVALSTYPSDHAATAFQIMATVVVSYALVATVFASFSSPPKTRVLGLVLGIMLAEFSLFQMIAFSCMAAVAAESESRSFFASIISVGAWFLRK